MINAHEGVYFAHLKKYLPLNCFASAAWNVCLPWILKDIFHYPIPGKKNLKEGLFVKGILLAICRSFCTVRVTYETFALLPIPWDWTKIWAWKMLLCPWERIHDNGLSIIRGLCWMIDNHYCLTYQTSPASGNNDSLLSSMYKISINEGHNRAVVSHTDYSRGPCSR